MARLPFPGARAAVSGRLHRLWRWSLTHPKLSIPAAVVVVALAGALVAAVTGDDDRKRASRFRKGPRAEVLGGGLENVPGVAPPAVGPPVSGGPGSGGGAPGSTAAAQPTQQVIGRLPFAVRPVGRQPAPSPECVRFRGGTLGVAVAGQDPGHLNPAVDTNGGLHTAAEPMYNGLLGFDENSNPYPDLAERWVISEEGRRYEFKLRPGVVWHDGAAFSSADVRFTFKEALLKYHARTRASMSSAFIDIDTPDALTVVFRFNRPYAPLLQQLNVTEAPIIPLHRYRGTDPRDNTAANRSPVGTGAFRLASYNVNGVTLSRNPRYFRPSLPCFDGMAQRFVGDAQNGILALQRGDLHWAWTVPGASLAPLRGDRGVALPRARRGPGGGNCLMTVGFNLWQRGAKQDQIRSGGAPPHPILANPEVRKAIAQAVNRQQFLDAIEFRQGRVPAAPIHSAIGFAHVPQPIPAFNLAQANQRLDAAGFPRREGGMRFSIDFWGLSGGTQRTYGELLRAQLREVGVDVVVNERPLSGFAAQVFANRQFDTAIVSYCHGDDPQIGVRRQYHSAEISTASFTNLAGYLNPDMNVRWDQAGQQVDPGAARGAYAGIQALAVQDQPYLWLVETDFSRAHRANCAGFSYTDTGLFAQTAFCRR